MNIANMPNVFNIVIIHVTVQQSDSRSGIFIHWSKSTLFTALNIDLLDTFRYILNQGGLSIVMVQQSEHSQIRALIWVHIVYWAHFSATRINKLIKLKVWFHPLTLSAPKLFDNFDTIWIFMAKMFKYIMRFELCLYCSKDKCLFLSYL